MPDLTDRRLPLFEPLEVRRLLSAGQLDLSFGDGGIVVTDRGMSVAKHHHRSPKQHAQEAAAATPTPTPTVGITNLGGPQRVWVTVIPPVP